MLLAFFYSQMHMLMLEKVSKQKHCLLPLILHLEASKTKFGWLERNWAWNQGYQNDVIHQADGRRSNL